MSQSSLSPLPAPFLSFPTDIAVRQLLFGAWLALGFRLVPITVRKLLFELGCTWLGSAVIFAYPTFFVLSPKATPLELGLVCFPKAALLSLAWDCFGFVLILIVLILILILTTKT